MRLLFLLLIAARIWGVAPNTVALYVDPLCNPQNSTNDGSGNGYTVTPVGSVAFVTSPTAPIGTHSLGTFTDSDYWPMPAGVIATMSGAAAGTIQHYAYFNSIVNQPVIWVDDGTGSFLQVLSTGAVKLTFNGNTIAGVITTAPGAVTSGTFYHIASIWDSATLSIYIDGASAVSASYAFAWGPVSNLTFGRYLAAPTFSMNGYLCQVRISNAAFTQLPTTDQVIRYKLKLDLRLKLSRVFKLLFPPVKAEARLDDQFTEAEYARAFERSRWTPTRTPTMLPTPTVTPTPTRTRTPGP